MRVYERGKSGRCDCVHHVRGFKTNRKGEIVGLCWMCELDEYDPLVPCRKGECNYYRKEKTK